MFLISFFPRKLKALEHHRVSKFVIKHPELLGFVNDEGHETLSPLSKQADDIPFRALDELGFLHLGKEEVGFKRLVLVTAEETITC